MQVLDPKITSLRRECEHYNQSLAKHQSETGHNRIVDDCYLCHYWTGTIAGLQFGLAVLESGE